MTVDGRAVARTASVYEILRIISVDAGRVVAPESLLRQAQDVRQPTGSSGTDRAQEEPAGGGRCHAVAAGVS